MNRTEMLEKAKAFAAGWWNDLGDHPSYHFASCVAGILAYIVLRFFVK